MTAVQLDQQALEAPRIPQPRGEVRVYELVLVAVPSATTCARLLVTYAATRWRLDPGCKQELDRVAEALVRHAITAASGRGRPTSHPRVLELQDLIVFRLHLTSRAIVVEVWDAAAEAPVRFPVDAAEDGGCDLPREGLRVLWCAVRLTLAKKQPESRSHAGIPRRQRIQGPPRASVAMRDPALLQRVLRGLQALDTGREQDAPRP